MKTAKLIYKLDPQKGTNKLRYADQKRDHAELLPWELELERRTLEIHAAGKRDRLFRFQTPLPDWSPDFRLRVVDEGPRRSRAIELLPIMETEHPRTLGWPEEFLFGLRSAFAQASPSLDRSVCVDFVLNQMEMQGQDNPRLLMLLLLKGYIRVASELFDGQPESAPRLGFYKVTEEELERLGKESAPEDDSNEQPSWIVWLLTRYLRIGPASDRG